MKLCLSNTLELFQNGYDYGGSQEFDHQYLCGYTLWTLRKIIIKLLPFCFREVVFTYCGRLYGRFFEINTHLAENLWGTSHSTGNMTSQLKVERSWRLPRNNIFQRHWRLWGDFPINIWHAWQLERQYYSIWRIAW